MEVQTRTKLFSGGQGLSLAKPEERFTAWYQDFHRGEKVRVKTQLEVGVSFTGKGQGEWDYKSH